MARQKLCSFPTLYLEDTKSKLAKILPHTPPSIDNFQLRSQDMFPLPDVAVVFIPESSPLLLSATP